MSHADYRTHSNNERSEFNSKSHMSHAENLTPNVSESEEYADAFLSSENNLKEELYHVKKVKF